MWPLSQTIRAALLGLVLAAPGLPAPVLRAEPAAEEVSLAYSMHLGGFLIGEVAMTALIGPEEYEAHSTLVTKGVADALFRSHYETMSAGAIENGIVRPERYASDFKGAKDKYQIVRMSYDGTAPRLDLADPSYDKARAKYPVAEELQRATVDPLSAMMFVIVGSTAHKDAPCGGTVPIYDGKRRYNLSFTLRGERETQLRDERAFARKVLVCAMEYQRIAGFKTKKRDDDEFPIPPLEVEMSRSHHARLLVPVRVTAETPIGDAVLVLERFAAVSAGARTAARSP